MRFRTLAMSVLWVGIFVTTVMALRSANAQAKANPNNANNNAIPPSPGTVPFNTAPKPVQTTFSIETKNAKIELLGKSSDGEFYRAIVGIDKNNYQISVAKDGQLLDKVLQPIRSEVKKSELPKAVQMAMDVEAKNAEFEVAEKVIGGKRTDYIVDVKLNKVSYELMFAEDGTLLSKIIVDDEEPTAEKPKEAPKDVPAKKK